MSTAQTELKGAANDSRAAFRYPAFKLFQTARCLVVFALEMQAVAVGWQVYEITKRPLDLGLVGLAQFLPGIVLFLVAGHVADVLDRKKVLITCDVGFGICFVLLLALTASKTQSVAAIYAVLVLLGIVRSFNGPASRAILPHFVADEHFQNSVAWASGIFQLATILGPVLGGVVYAIFRGPFAVYLIATVITAIAVGLLIKLQFTPKPRVKGESTTSSSVFEGFRYIWREKLILGAISLDLFAVLLGGAVALLPVYAKEILQTGPWGLGLLRSAPGIGAGIMAIVIAYKPLRKNVGATMLWCVAAFGLFTVLFGISRSMVFSLISLFMVGATDMVSVIVRGTLIQVATPDQMRGRVNAVDMIFIGASNELGQFESGVTAQWLGSIPAVILGGVGAIVVTALWAWMFPALREVDHLEFKEKTT